MEVIAGYDENIQAAVANLRTGIAGKCKFLPTVADIVEMGDRLQMEQAASRPRQKPVLVEIHQSPEDRERIGKKMAALAAELAKTKIIEPVAPATPRYVPKLSRAALDAELAAIGRRNTPERLAAIEAAIDSEDPIQLNKALSS